ncbi:hypothetical protein NEMIN01_0313 [Nematocida minor]|uniref:uncharacterized protein n=1 Tax=Nematocida minor TaxID=1912983 RepID=UPI00221FDF30|nr:uncharacterized protein NEMIN01_0313 [Nematocida minor]KAI5189147.1 hypothetical protein NEMIN01_0313 [Nematocida minor]
MKSVAFLACLLTVSAYSVGIDLSMCSPDRMYCFDDITQSIVKVGAHSLTAPFGVSYEEPGSLPFNMHYHSNPANFSQPDTSDREVWQELRALQKNYKRNLKAAARCDVGYNMNKAVHRQMSIDNMYKRRARLAPECGVDHMAVRCKVIPAIHAMHSGMMQNRVIHAHAPMASSVVSPMVVRIRGGMGQGGSMGSDGYHDECDERHIVTRTPRAICFTKPKKQFLTVQCCKVSRIPVRGGGARKTPCICADGSPAEPMMSYPGGIDAGMQTDPETEDAGVQTDPETENAGVQTDPETENAGVQTNSTGTGTDPLTEEIATQVQMANDNNQGLLNTKRRFYVPGIYSSLASERDKAFEEEVREANALTGGSYRRK